MRENWLYLILSVFLSMGRNIMSKKTANDANEKSQFFLTQTVLFFSSALLLLVFNIKNLATVSAVTLIYGIIYGVLLILSQWMLTIALKYGGTSVCTVIYSLGFILPTISGALFWNETFTFINIVGVFIAIVVILLTAKKNEKESKSPKSFVPFIVIAMISSGGLGIMQKVQQSTDAADEKGVFLFVAFTFAFCSSLVAFLVCRDGLMHGRAKVLYPAITGICFGGANLCNTILAGRMKSAVFFPVQNVSTILLSTLFGVVIFKEKITSKTVAIIILTIAVIILFSL